ncbi:Acyl-CoA N-acyltransferase [Ascosphaera apis ARSEF 7405]|uniref:Acyl-CoA N-acyltransferase n=1 Tax=Ascosphaera apis ARSEF 7405 TaxID=392613 RepID=A0A167Y0A0_9EURO|nr:Acyl-CoA N-acyltransferase [Ascosphaera apis ARSEF 7405]
MATSVELPYLPPVCLPEPWKVRYELSEASSSSDGRIFQLLKSNQQRPDIQEPPAALHNPGLFFSELLTSPQNSLPKDNDNTAWARACRYLVSFATWDGDAAPTAGQIWLVVYALLSLKPTVEHFRFAFTGKGKEQLQRDLLATGLANPYPNAPETEQVGDIVISRVAFWQGAGSPFGPRPAWIAQPDAAAGPRPSESVPAFPLQYTLTSKFGSRPVHSVHPIRPQKPSRGATFYSRYIPHLDEFFSMVHLDYTNEEHLNLFHKWQNDPRVAVNWQETGTLEEHRKYLKDMDEDPHQFAVLAKFDDNYFAYFEIYWAKEDHMGTYYPAQDWDRGRHSLVGDARFRGPHRATAWWTSLIHFIFLDDPRTSCVVGEPKATNEPVLAYDATHGFHVHKWGDLPHKRSAMVRCERVRFFELVSFGHTTSNGTVKPAKSKL